MKQHVIVRTASGKVLRICQTTNTVTQTRDQLAELWEAIEKINETIEKPQKQAKMKKATTPDSSREEIKKFYRLSKELCKRTGEKWHVDHTVPISMGGLHHQDNLQVVPAEWNLKKGGLSSEAWDGEYPDWVADYKKEIGL